MKHKALLDDSSESHLLIALSHNHHKESTL
ncbi:hypothetical protein PP47_gp08 [Pectobacterium phage PP47]|uniref:Uncharacterized protein n=2 Tax=Pektosvirus TaxID=2732689 RepID=A0A3B8GHP2_9CAUD|nr:hypothetical protein HOR48_gp08 [Pectobacterium phage PP81]YP_009788705.1 hypothetical protein HOR52_gp08 [Pectobacterium phage PP47]AYM47365.1 hypothetical protein PP47_gp08 [Pectobacterium phage PP47]AYM47377.1 hypothetical protein PP81_gp08 [Pectobacterium phage PP81]